MIEAELAKMQERPAATTGNIIRNQVMAGLFGKSWYRCKIMRQRKRAQSDQPPSWDVLFIDYGNTFALGKHQLQPLPRELMNFPPMAKKCKLAFLDPSKDTSQRDMSGHWLSNMVMEKKLSLKIRLRILHYAICLATG